MTEALTRIAEMARQTLGARLCTVARVDLEGRWLTTVACAGCDQALQQLMAGHRFRLGSPTQGTSLKYELIASGQPIEKYGLQASGQGIIDPEIAVRFGINSALCFPLVLGKEFLGYLNHFSASGEPCDEIEQKLLATFARYTILTFDYFGNLTGRDRLEKLNTIMQRMSEVQDIEELLVLTLDEGMALVGATRGWISRLDLDTGLVSIVKHRGEPPKLRSLAWGQGITGKALQEERSICVDDVRSPEWQGVYEEFWPDTRSELAVPIVVDNAAVRVGHDLERGTKPIGVFNVERARAAAFGKTDESILRSLARQVAVMIERLETDRKLADLGSVQQDIIVKRDWDEVIKVLTSAITGTLGYQYVNISIVVPELNLIRTERILGVPEGMEEEFKKLANHSLDSDDIQADTVRSRIIEVPHYQDKRFDQNIYHRFHHEQLIRVYVPMVVSADNRVIGTVEAGYYRKYRRYIYERDVQILKGFVDYAVQALEQRKKGLLDQICHELRLRWLGSGAMPASCNGVGMRSMTASSIESWAMSWQTAIHCCFKSRSWNTC